MKTIGVLTGGGDCPGLNAAIRAVTRKAILHDIQVVGIEKGWLGLIVGDTVPLTQYYVSGILHKGGTILGTTRTNPFNKTQDIQKCLENYKRFGLDCLIAIGGEDTLGVGARFIDEGLRIIGIPKTIDNDLAGTDATFGFDTAINIVTEAIDRLHTTAESHNRVMIVEVMGRHSGWIAVEGGIAGGADQILIPEFPIDMDEVCENIRKRHDLGKDFSIVVVAEGAKIKGQDEHITLSRGTDPFGHVRLGGIGAYMAEKIEKRTRYEVRVTQLGHVQRGGTPTAYDRVLATRYGVKAVECFLQGDFGKMVSLKGNEIVPIPLNKDALKPKNVPKELYEVAKVFFG